MDEFNIGDLVYCKDSRGDFVGEIHLIYIYNITREFGYINVQSGSEMRTFVPSEIRKITTNLIADLICEEIE